MGGLRRERGHGWALAHEDYISWPFGPVRGRTMRWPCSSEPHRRQGGDDADVRHDGPDRGVPYLSLPEARETGEYGELRIEALARFDSGAEGRHQVGLRT